MFSLISTDSVDLQTVLEAAKPEVIVSPGNVKAIEIQVGDHYLLAQNVAGKNELLKDIVALRKGDDLVILHADGSEIIFSDYYLICASSNDSEQALEDSCSVTVAGEGVEEHTFYAEESASGESRASDTSSIVYSQVNHSPLENLAGSDVELDKGANTLIEPIASSSSLLSSLGGLAAGGAAIGGGGGSGARVNSVDDTRSTSSIAAPVAKAYSVNAILGPEINPGSDTLITIYKADGVALGVMEYDVATAKYTYTDVSGYSGVVLLHLQDTDPLELDYIDETTGEATHLTTDLYIAGTVSNAQENIGLSITPLTTIAALKIGVLVGEGKVLLGSGTVSEAHVEAMNEAVAVAFGILDSDGFSNADVKTTINSEGGQSSDANAYGRALAIISAAEQSTTGGIGKEGEISLADVINFIVNNLAISGAVGSLSTSAKALFITVAPKAGISEAEASILLGTHGAFAKLQAYADGSSTIAPTVADYEAAGVMGVDADNLNATNAGVSSSTSGAIGSLAAIQGIAATSNTAADAALAKVQAYADGSSTDAPTVADYEAAGVTGVDDDNLNATNAGVSGSDGAVSVAAIQGIAATSNTAADAALAKVQAYADGSSADAPTVADYETAGVTGVDDDNLSATNAGVSGSDGAVSVAAIQGIAASSNTAADAALA